MKKSILSLFLALCLCIGMAACAGAEGKVTVYMPSPAGLADKLAAAQITPVWQQPENTVYICADGRLVWRAMSNLLSNAVKYAQPGTRLYVDMTVVDQKVLISFKNISRDQLNVSADELLERFVRGEASRNTEGSGLGLNIAQSLMELQHGKLELLVDGDLFKVTLICPKTEAQ